MSPSETPTIWLVAGEESGDQLGAGLIRALRRRFPGQELRFGGVGGTAMLGAGLRSLFPLEEIAVMGIGPVLARLPSLVERVRRTAAAIVEAQPDVLVIVDSPGFTHAVARRVRRRLPEIPIVDYVSPSVWAWRPGRARRMRAYVDHVLGLLPFEPEAHRRLGGPTCTYVGHPLVERLAELRPGPGEREPVGEGPVRLLVLPGSRRSEVTRLMAPFGKALHLVAERLGRPLEPILPAVAHLEAEIRAAAAGWTARPRIVLGEGEKLAAFRAAHGALAASGTVTLELALAGVPLVAAYRVSKVEEQLKYLIRVPSIVLPNLVLGENVVPEYLQEECTPERLAAGLVPLLSATPARQRQLDAFARLDAVMATDGQSPSERAAAIVAAALAAGRARSGSAGPGGLSRAGPA